MDEMKQWSKCWFTYSSSFNISFVTWTLIFVSWALEEGQGSDRFRPNRPNRPWPRAPRFWGPAQLFSMTTQYQLIICETAQRHNFTIYLEMSGNASVYSRLLSVQ